jgi:hypothetical protein
MSYRSIVYKSLGFAALTIGTGCTSLFGSGENNGDNNGMELAVQAAYSLSCSQGVVRNKFEPVYAGGPECTTGISSSAPDWVRENFHCVTVRVCGQNMIFSSNHPSPERIGSQNVSLTIPINPAPVTSDMDATAGMTVVGISTHGVPIYGNEAATGVRENSENLKIDSDELIGVMLDGYPVYGKRKQNGSYPTLDVATNTATCATTHFPNGTYCYHVAHAAGIDGYVIGNYFRGRRGTLN